jgi:hypothetical protein
MKTVLTLSFEPFVLRRGWHACLPCGIISLVRISRKTMRRRIPYMSIPVIVPLPRTRKGIKITMAVIGSLFLIGASSCCASGPQTRKRSGKKAS